MTQFHTVAIIDWSGGNDTGPRPRKDAIWLGLTRDGVDHDPIYIRNRMEAEKKLHALITEETAANRRLFLGFDFPFAFPRGFARALTGSDNPFGLWSWFADNLTDSPRANNRFHLAAHINAQFPGIGPFWFNALKADLPHLPRKDIRHGHDLPEKRAVEDRTKGAFPCWQIGGAGAVGGQIFTGLPVLHRLRAGFPNHIATWPFEPLDKPVVLVEIWPGLINPIVKQAEAKGGIRDAHQVRLLARAVSRLHPDDLTAMLAVDAPEEGWIMGVEHEDKLMAAADDTLRPPPLRDDCFALPAGVDWTPVDDALAMLRARLHPVVGTETVPLTRALGRILADDITALRANPAEANTAVDGYAFAHASLSTGDQTLPLAAGRAAAGKPFDGTVPPGHAIRVLTGAALPKGVDTVILQEDVTASDTAIAFRPGIKPGANTRKAGEDVDIGQTVLPKSRRITPADLALLAATGHARLPVYAPLRVGVVSTGDELVEPGDPAATGQIFDANRPMLLGLIAQLGFTPVDLGRVADNRDALRETLDKGAEQTDLILTSGGASSGDEDHVSSLLNATGAMAQWRIAVKPGRPLALGLWNGTPVFGLPGNPVAALVCTLIFARPAMGILSGEGWHQPQGLTLPAAFTKTKKPGRREYLRARMRDKQVEVFKSEGSGRISGLSWAEGLVELPDGPATITPGDPVTYLPFSSFL